MADESAARSSTVRVAIHSFDDLTRSGLLGYMRYDSRLVLAESGSEADVTVVAADVADAATLGLLRKLGQDAGEEGLDFVVVGRRWEANISVAVELGVRAVLLRTAFGAPDFVRTLITVARGGASLPPSLQAALMDQMRLIQQEVLAPRGLTASGVSTREVDVLRLVAEGWELSDIAKKLAFSERTIKYVLYGMMKRLHLRNRAHAVSYAIRAGLI